MRQVNLLPWRVYAAERRKKIYIIMGSCFVLSAVSIFFIKNMQAVRVTPVVHAPHVVLTVNNTMDSIPLQRMKWQGYIKENHITWALMMLPDHKTYAVQAGSVIGLEKAKVLEISDKSMTVMVQNEKKVIYYEGLNGENRY